MKKVYILMGGCIDDQHVVGVYSSEKKAEEERKDIIEKDNYYRQYPNDLYVGEFELDAIKKYF